MQYNGRKLPPGWVQCVSTKYGRDYFFDTQTGKSVWFAPSAADATGAAAEGAGAGRLAAGATTTEEQQQQSPSAPPAKRSRQEPPPPPPLEEGNKDSSAGSVKTKVAVIVPYRDLDPAQRRSAHLEQFVPYMESFLAREVGGGAGRGSIGGYRVYIVEQSADGRKFNRGKLLNIGFDLARREGCGAFLFHDVDLLPSEKLGR